MDLFVGHTFQYLLDAFMYVCLHVKIGKYLHFCTTFMSSSICSVPSIGGKQRIYGIVQLMTALDPGSYWYVRDFYWDMNN